MTARGCPQKQGAGTCAPALRPEDVVRTPAGGGPAGDEAWG